MASFTTIILFFIYLWGLGYAATIWVKNAENIFERNLMRIGIGFAGFALVSVLLNIFRLPIDWKIFLVLSLLGPLYGTIRAYRNKTIRIPEIKLTKSTLAIFIVVLMFAFTFFMYAKGSFSYAYLEDSDPWGYAIAAKFVAIEKTLEDPPWTKPNDIGYIDPYPPLYVTLMGILHQTAPELNWVLKFFNSLIASLGIIFFYFFALKFTNNRQKALFATAVLTAVPSYLSHFIWSHALIPTTFFVIMYAILMSREDKKWLGIAALTIAGFLFTHHRQPFNLFFFLAPFVIIASITAKRIRWDYIATGAAGLIISFLWWLPGKRWIEAFQVTGVAERTPEWASTLQSGNIFSVIFNFIMLVPKYFRPTGGTGTRTYFFNDFFFAQKVNMINNPVGIGIVIYLLLFTGILVLLFIMKKQMSTIRSKTTQVALKTCLMIGAVMGIILTLRYFTVLMAWFTTGNPPFPFLLSLWFDLILYITTAVAAIITLAATKETSETQEIQTNEGLNINIWVTTALTWLAAFFILVTPTSFHIPFGIEPWRTWMHLSTPIALLATEGACALSLLIRRYRYATTILFTLLIVGMIFTSGIQKYAVNANPWPPGGGFTSNEERQGYEWLLQLPPNTKVFPYSGRGVNAIGLNAWSCSWCKEEVEFRKQQLDRTPEELSTFLKSMGYEYLMLDAMTLKQLPRYSNHTKEEVEKRFPEKLEEIGRSGLFERAHQTNGVIILKVP